MRNSHRQTHRETVQTRDKYLIAMLSLLFNTADEIGLTATALAISGAFIIRVGLSDTGANLPGYTNRHQGTNQGCQRGPVSPSLDGSFPLGRLRLTSTFKKACQLDMNCSDLQGLIQEIQKFM